MNWAGGATKDDILAHLAGRDDALRTMVNEYLAEGTYQGMGEVMALIPAQAWQDAQGDTWRGPESLDPDDMDSNFKAGRVGRDTSDVYRTGNSAPSTPGFGQTGGGNAVGADTGDAGSTTSEVDPGVSGRGETIGTPPESTGGAGQGNAVGGWGQATGSDLPTEPAG